MLVRFAFTLLGVVALASSSACEDDFTECDEPTAAALAVLPASISQANLFSDISTETLAEGVYAYKPRFELWTDGATKRRWFSLPVGEMIDTSDRDQWRFPTGTTLFKEFSRDGVRVETRILTKTGSEDDAWSASSYVWAQDQSDAFLAPEGGDNQLGTAHDVPAASDCAGCHDGRASRVLGFSALQLAWAAPEGFATVSTLKEVGILPDSVPEEIPLPANEEDVAALGYLHANCSHCHNAARPVSDGLRCYDPEENFDFSLPAAGIDTVYEAPAYTTGVAQNVLTPGDAQRSQMIQRFSNNGNARMPALGTEFIDAHGQALLTSWVNNL